MKQCAVEGCDRAFKAKGLCSAHHLQQLKGKPLTPIKRWKGKSPRLTCSIEECEKLVHSRGWCAMHVMRWKTHGDTSVCTTNRYLTMQERFWMKVQKGPGCWLWTGGSRDGYGTFTERYRGKTHLAHRLAYELVLGPVPEEKQLDHRCRNTLCVNPAHLRPVTHKQNMEHQAGAHRNSSTGVLGVTHRKRDGRFVAQVGHYGQVHRVPGSFAELKEAAEAVKALRLSLFTHNDVDRRSA